MNEGILLHIGCGQRYIPTFTHHIDAIKFPHVDIVASADKLGMFADNSVDLIYASHLLEHFGRHDIEKVLQEWYRVLKVGGTLRLAVPDFEKIVEVYQRTKDLEPLLGLLVGGQTYPSNTHRVIFDATYLSKVLSAVGFKNIHRYDWRQMIHKDYDDFSQAYLPYMDKEHGTLMSLNMECQR